MSNLNSIKLRLNSTKNKSNLTIFHYTMKKNNQSDKIISLMTNLILIKESIIKIKLMKKINFKEI